MKKLLLTVIAAIACSAAQAGVFTISSDEIIEGKTGSVELASNTYSSQSTSDQSTWYTFAKDSYNFTGAKICISPGNNGYGIQMQGNASDAAKQGLLGNTTTFGKISQIVLKLNTVTTSTYAPSFDICVGSDEMPTTAITLSEPETATETVNSKEYKTYTYTIDVTDGSGYFCIRNDKAGALYINEIDVTYEGEGTSKKSAGLKWSSSSVTAILGEAFTAPTLTKATTADVTFSVDDEDVATVDENGVITIQGLGTAMVTASCEANDEYEAGTATCVVNVIEPTVVTCAEAAAIAQAMESNNTPSTTLYAVTGYVTSTNGTVSKGQQTFYMADTKDGGNVFEGYWANIPDANDPLTVGSKVKMVGYIMKYNTTSEMKNATVTVLEKAIVEADTIECNAHEAYLACQQLAEGAYSDDYYKITAYVDSITYNFGNGTQSFTLTDVKGQKGDSLVVYRSNIAEAALVGAKVCVKGKLQNYKGTVMEVASGSTTTILEQGEDGIRSVAADSKQAAIYNLAGQRVSKAQKGIYIIGGTKVLK